MSESIVKLNEAAIKGRRATATYDDKQFDKFLSDIENVEDVVKTVIARTKAAMDYREPFEELWRRAFKAWMQILETTKENSWESKRFLPMILSHVESALPSIVSIAIGGENIWKCLGMTPNGRDAAAALEKLITWQARGPSNIEEATEDMLWWAVVIGTGFIDIRWSTLYEDRLVAEVVDDVDDKGNKLHDDNGQPIQVKVVNEREVKVEDFPVGESLNPLDVYACPWSKVGDNADWFVVRRETTIGRIQSAAGKGHVLKDAVEAWLTAAGDDKSQLYNNVDFFESLKTSTYDDWLTDVGLSSNKDYDQSEDKHDFDKPVVLLVYRSRTEMITIVAPGRIIGYSKTKLMHGKTGIISHALIPIPNCPYGRGLGTILLGHQELVNENLNLFMDVAKVSQMAPLVVSRSQISILDKNFRWQPNALIWARDVNNAAKRLDMPAPTDLAMTMDQHLRRDADDTSGFSEQSRGFSPAGVNTATEFSGLQANIKTRTFMHVRRLNRTLRRIGQMMVKLNQQFMTQEQVISYVGEEGLDYRPVKPWEIVGDVVVQATVTSSRAAPAMRAQQLIALTQVIAPILPQVQQIPFFQRWVRMLLEVVDVEDIDRLLPKNPAKVRSGIAENVGLHRGLTLTANPQDDHDSHLNAHIQELQLLMQSPGSDPAIVQAFQNHIQQHLSLAEAAGQAMAQGAQGGQGGPAAGNRGAVDPQRAEAQGLGAAQGANGTPGAASPGPQGPPGRAG